MTMESLDNLEPFEEEYPPCLTVSTYHRTEHYIPDINYAG